MTARRWFRIRLGCAALSAAMFTVAVIVLGPLTPGYSQWSDAVSRLASPGERWAVAARAVFAAYGLLVIAGAGTLRAYAGRRGHWLARCLVLYGVACVVAGVAPKDQPGAAHTLVSQVHVDACVCAGALAIAAMALVAAGGPTRAARRAAAVTAVATVAAAALFVVMWGTGVYGVCERVVLALGMCWISALAVRALTAEPRRQAPPRARATAAGNREAAAGHAGTVPVAVVDR